jgi:hypothetical protein
MTTPAEIAELSEMIRRMGGTITQDADTITVVGIQGIGPNPMPTIQAAERMREKAESQIGAAILGFRGAVRCCRYVGLDEDKVYEMVRDNTDHS